MPEKLIKKIRTSEGDLQIDYNALANLPDINKLEKDVKALEEILEDLPAGGGAVSWNDLTDKPFGEEGRTPITWDGVSGEEIPFDDVTYVKVSDVVLDKNECINATLTVIDVQGVAVGGVITEDMVNDTGIPGALIIGTAFVISVYDVEAVSSIMPGFTETGTYFLKNGATGAYTQAITFAGGEIKTLDEKFIPDTIARVSPNPVSIDFSAFDTEGKIIETFADSSSRTTTMEFDADGNPIKITDADGNVTILTWGG